MIKKYSWLYMIINFFLLIISSSCFGQVRIGSDNTVAITPGAMLEVASSATMQKGFLSARVSLANAAVWGLSGTSSDGMMVYNTNAGIIGGAGAGMYIFYNSRWNRMADNVSITALPRAMVSATVNQGGAASGGGFVQNQNYAIIHNSTDASTAGVAVSADGVQFTILSAGYYLISVNLRVYETTAATGTVVGERYLSIVKNATYNANYFTSGGTPLASTGMTTTGISSLSTNVMSYLAVGDTISANFVQTSNYINIQSDPNQTTMKLVKCSN
jgi:hypothetical protein